MPRKHTIWDSETQTQIDVMFTAEEETAADAEAIQYAADLAEEKTKSARIDVLEAKVDDDSITFPETKELMRLRKNVVEIKKSEE